MFTELLASFITLSTMVVGPAMLALVLVSFTLEQIIRGVTDGDYKGLFFQVHSGYMDRWTFRFFGKAYIEEVESFGFLLIALLLSFLAILPCLLVFDAGVGLVNPASLFLADALLVVLIIAGNYYFAKVLYKLVKKVRTLKEVLKTHVNDKDAHSSSSKSAETIYRETGERVTREMRDEFKKRFDY